MRYMLDTNIIVYAKNHRPQHVLDKMMSFAPSDLCISSITLSELLYGAAKSAHPTQNRLALMLFLNNIEVMPYGEDAAACYGDIRAELERAGTPIEAHDLLIAAHAKSLGLPLVTNNTKHFGRVSGLVVENWA